MFPNDTISFSFEFCGQYNNFDVSTLDQSTIVGIAMQQENNSSDTTIKCGNDPIARNYATNYSHVPMNHQCENDIHVDKTGNDCAFVIINYRPLLSNNYSTTTEVYNPKTEIASTSDVVLYGSFTAGEIVMSFLLLCLIVLALMTQLARALSNIKTKKTFLQYGGGDVEVRDDL
jgi:hypothetical protein